MFLQEGEEDNLPRWESHRQEYHLHRLSRSAQVLVYNDELSVVVVEGHPRHVPAI